MRDVIQLIINQFKQPSTWSGIGVLANALGVVLSPEAWGEIGMAVIAVIGAFEIVRNERKSR
jgi:hypothetical protein